MAEVSEGIAMKHFKNESREYREARDRLLRSEIALREQVLVPRWQLRFSA